MKKYVIAKTDKETGLTKFLWCVNSTPDKNNIVWTDILDTAIEFDSKKDAVLFEKAYIKKKKKVSIIER